MGLFSTKSKDKTAATPVSVALSTGETVSLAQQIDCLGDSCPRPQLLTKKALTAAAPNDVVGILVDNPTSMEALPPLCESLSATHLETLTAAKGWHVVIRKNA